MASNNSISIKHGDASYMLDPIPRKKRKFYFSDEPDSTADGGCGLLSLSIPRKKKYSTTDCDAKRPSKRLKSSNLSHTPINLNLNPKQSDTTDKRSHWRDNDESANQTMPFQKIKIGRTSGYHIVVTQGKTEYDAILLNCNTDNPQDHLTNHIHERVKIRWQGAGYNDAVLASSVRLKHIDGPRPIRKAAEMSGLLSGGNHKEINKDEYASTIINDNDDEEYKDEEDCDEALVCYTKTVSVGCRSTGLLGDACNNAAMSVNDVTENGGLGDMKDRSASNRLINESSFLPTSKDEIKREFKTKDTDDYETFHEPSVLVDRNGAVVKHEEIYDADTDNEEDRQAIKCSIFEAVVKHEDIYDADTDNEEDHQALKFSTQAQTKTNPGDSGHDEDVNYIDQMKLQPDMKTDTPLSCSKETLDMSDATENPPWFIKRVCVQLKEGKSVGIIQKIVDHAYHRYQAILMMSDKSTMVAMLDEISPIIPQKKDRVLVTKGLYRGKEGDLISTPKWGTKAMIKEEGKKFIRADFNSLAKVYSNQAFGKLVREVWHKCFVCKSYTPRLNLEPCKGTNARCYACACESKHDLVERPCKSLDRQICSHCSDFKGRQLFDEVQWVLGDDGTCYECIALMKSLREGHVCFHCNIAKMKQSFSGKQWSLGDYAKCKECVYQTIKVNKRTMQSQRIDSGNKTSRCRKRQREDNQTSRVLGSKWRRGGRGRRLALGDTATCNGIVKFHGIKSLRRKLNRVRNRGRTCWRESAAATG